MAVIFVLETGAGLLNSNSYASLDESDDYLYVKPNSDAWAAQSDTDKERYLLWSARLMEQRVRWNGVKAVAASALSWPRDYLVDRDGIPVPNNVVPDEVKAACIEIAYHLFSHAVDPSAPVVAGSTGVKRYKLDVLEIEYQDSALTTFNPFPLGLNAILAPLGSIASSGPNFVPITRV